MPTDATTTLADLKTAIGRFCQERDWEQFHDLKNLAMAIASEAGELLAHFRWVRGEEAAGVLHDPASAREVEHEVADVLLLLAEFARVAGIDLAQAATAKLALNAQRYPVEQARGKAVKYNRLPPSSRPRRRAGVRSKRRGT